MGAAEDVRKMDELFTGSRATEAVTADDALALLGAVIRKGAADTEADADELRARMQRAFLVSKCVHDWAADESDDAPDEVAIPVDLLAAVRKDAEGEDGDVVPVSVALTAIGKRTMPASDEGDGNEPTGDEEPVSWGTDLAAEPVEKSDGDDATDDDDWGADPAGVK
jgi:hypothetical protein